jgi:hypothetical protein
LPSTRNLIASEEYEVEAILGHKLTSKKNRIRECIWCGGKDMNLQKILGFQNTTYAMLQL